MSSPATQEKSGNISQQKLFEIADRVLPGSCLGSYSLAEDIRLIYSHGRGSRMWDVDGNEYIDYVGGAGALILGHSHPGIVRAAQAQFERGAHMFGSLTDVAVHLAERLGRTRRTRCAATGWSWWMRSRVPRKSLTPLPARKQPLTPCGSLVLLPGAAKS